MRCLATSPGVPGDYPGQTSVGMRMPYGGVSVTTPLKLTLTLTLAPPLTSPSPHPSPHPPPHLTLTLTSPTLTLRPHQVITPFSFPLEICALQTCSALFMGNRPTVHVDRRVAIVMEQARARACHFMKQAWARARACAFSPRHALTNPHNPSPTPPPLTTPVTNTFIRMLHHVGLPAEDIDYIYRRPRDEPARWSTATRTYASSRDRRRSPAPT